MPGNPLSSLGFTVFKTKPRRTFPLFLPVRFHLSPPHARPLGESALQGSPEGGWGDGRTGAQSIKAENQLIFEKQNSPMTNPCPPEAYNTIEITKHTQLYI